MPTKKKSPAKKAAKKKPAKKKSSGTNKRPAGSSRPGKKPEKVPTAIATPEQIQAGTAGNPIACAVDTSND